MKNSFRFFRNVDCRYFPCHENSDVETFNCLFCYCPLYFLKDQCGGNFEYVGEKKDVKSCLHCLFPHIPENYDLINAKLKEVRHGDKPCNT